MAGAGTGNSPCAECTIPPPTFNGEQTMRSAAGPFHRERDADDVDDGVEGADLVEVDLLDRHLVDGGFRFRQPLKHAPSRGRERSRTAPIAR